MKRALSIILSAAIILSCFCGFSITAEASTYSYTSGDLSCTLDTSTGVFTVSGEGRGADYSSSATNRPGWYTRRSSIKTVVVESGVIQIGAYWFYNCANLAQITIPDTVDTIGDDCFRSCTSLTGIVLPKNCSWYYKELFLSCTSLKWVILPENNYTGSYSGKIPDGLFSGCTALEEVYVGSGHTAMDQKAFYNCKALKSVVWASGSITETGTNALYNVPSTCRFFSADNALGTWASGNSVSASSLSGGCCDNGDLSYSFVTADRALKLDFTGSGTMTSTPWSDYHYLIKEIYFENTDGLCTLADSAFSDYINLETASFALKNVEIPENCFDLTQSLTFYGVKENGVYDYVKNGRSNGADWHYYCLNDGHEYSFETIAPTCTEQGYDLCTCPNCDAEDVKNNFTKKLGHSYSKCVGVTENNAEFLYSCKRCDANTLKASAISLQLTFQQAISADKNSSPYNFPNYQPKYDIKYDGYINAKDFHRIFDAANKINLTNTKTLIDTSTQYQTIEGFGASGCWWAQDVGRWSDEQIDRVTELLYGETGAGLSIYRYNLGGGSEDDTYITDWRRRAEDFLLPSSNIDDPDTYDWSADEAARNVLSSAQRANSNLKVTLFSNSAPVSLTDNGKAYCSNGASQNLSESNYQAFATYVANCAEHFINEGYNVTNVSPINEPEWAWAADSNGYCSQEGCHFKAADARNFYNTYMIPTLQSRSLLNGKVGVSVWECAQLNHSSTDLYKTFLPYMFSSQTSMSSTTNYAANNSNIRSYCDSLDTHSYWASTSDREQVAADISDSNYSAIKNVRCTEYCQMTNDASNNVLGHIQSEGNTNGMTIAYGLALADIIYQDLTILNACEWDWWTACSGGIYPDGLVYVDYDNPDNVQTSKRLWAMGNYSKFIQDGAKRVSVTTESGFASDISTDPDNIYSWADDWGNSGTDKNTYVEQTAYLNPDGSVVVVYINNSDTNVFTGFDGYSTLETYVTSETKDLELYQSGTAVNRAVEIPAMSITTVVLNK